MKRDPYEFYFSHSGIHLLPLAQDQVMQHGSLVHYPNEMPTGWRF